jgi:hypothetical protein
MTDRAFDLLRLATLGLLLLAMLAGCSAKEAIRDAANEVTTQAGVAGDNIRGAKDDLAKAKATGEVGPKAAPFLDSAVKKLDIAAIAVQACKDAASIVTNRVDETEDKDGWLTRVLKSAAFIITLIAAVVLSVFYAPIIRPILLHIGAWLNLIPKPVRVDAEADAAYIASNSNPASSDVTAVRAIELKKASDPRYRKALDKALNKEGVAT